MTQDLESPSGLGRYLPLALELTQKGHMVQIAALHSNYQRLKEKRLQINGVDVQYVAPMHVKKQGSAKSYYSPLPLLAIILWSTWALIKHSLFSQVDVILIAKPHPMNSIAGLTTKFFGRKRLFLDCDDYEAESNRFVGQWQKKIVAFFEKRIPQHVELITTNTYFMQEKLISWGISKDRIVYLPNGVDQKRFQQPNQESTRRLRNQLNLSNKKVIAYIGTVSFPSHPVDLLITAFPRILSRYPNSALLIVGGGEDLEKAKEIATKLGIQDHTIFIGRIPYNDVPLYYSISDVTVDPVYDNAAARGRSPLKLFESWICGVPFVTASVGDRAELIGNPPAGVLISPGNPTALADGVLEVIQNPEKVDGFIKEGLNRVKYFNWQLLTQRLEKTLSMKYP